MPGENSVKVQVASFPSATRYFTATAKARSIVQLPLLYWIEEGNLYRFRGSGKEELTTGGNLVSFTVDVKNNKLYWATQTVENKGEIYRANLDGKNPNMLLDNLYAVPLNIAVNPLNNGLYWTNESGRILCAIPKTKGEMGYGSIQVIYEQLASPQYIALDVSQKKIYWTEVTEVNEDMTWKIQVGELPADRNGKIKNKKNVPATLGPVGGHCCRW